MSVEIKIRSKFTCTADMITTALLATSDFKLQNICIMKLKYLS